jgi:hypothetical protein
MKRNKTDMDSSSIDFDPSAFIVKEEPKIIEPPNVGKTKKPKKKRKTPYDDDEMSDLRKKAESLCKCWEQARLVRKYKKERLKDFIQQHEFDSDNELRETVFSFIHKGYSTALDLLLKGNGHVGRRLSDDNALRSAIEQEGRDFVKYLSNKMKILMLSTGGIYDGKMIQMEAEKNKATVVEIDDEPLETELNDPITKNDDSSVNEENGNMGEVDEVAESTDSVESLESPEATEEVLPLPQEQQGL